MPTGDAEDDTDGRAPFAGGGEASGDEQSVEFPECEGGDDEKNGEGDGTACGYDDKKCDQEGSEQQPGEYAAKIH